MSLKFLSSPLGIKPFAYSRKRLLESIRCWILRTLNTLLSPLENQFLLRTPSNFLVESLWCALWESSLLSPFENVFCALEVRLRQTCRVHWVPHCIFHNGSSLCALRVLVKWLILCEIIWFQVSASASGSPGRTKSGRPNVRESHIQTKRNTKDPV